MFRKTPTYAWTPEMDAELTRLYRTSKGKCALSAAITALANRYRMPRYIVQNRAQHLNLRSRIQREWTQADIDVLLEYAGTTSMERLAKRLGRSPAGVKHKLFTLDVAGRVTEGFSQNELAKLVGVHHSKVGAWIRKGWLVIDNGRISQDSVEQFVWEHMDEFRFAACEEWWLKTMLKANSRRPAPSGIALALGRHA